MAKAKHTPQKVYSWCYYGYKAYQLGRLASGDITVLAELIMEQAGEEITQEAAMELAVQFFECFDSTNDYVEACKQVAARKCSTCGNAGHNRATCKRWVWETFVGR